MKLEDYKFTTNDDLMKVFLNFFDLKKSSQEEKDNWPYKCDLNISIKNVIGKELIYKGEYVGYIEKCYFNKIRGKKSVIIEIAGKKYDLTNSKIKIYNPFYEKKTIIMLHPSRGGKNFWERCNLLKEKEYKSFFYKTKEYRKLYEKSLNKNLNTRGLTAPIQSDKIKNKISKTIKERYGVDWFLKRGTHYSDITYTMLERYGKDNFFKDYDWQIENVKKINKNLKETSVLESDIIKVFENIKKDKDLYHKFSEKGQKILKYGNRNYYKLDFYDSKNNVVAEIMGDYWHCNPDIYSENFFHKNKKKIATQIWEEDLKRKNNIINLLNCKFIEIWESDWLNNKESVISYINSVYENI